MTGHRVSTDRSGWRESGRIDGVDDVRRVLNEINATGLHSENTALARDLVRTADDAALTGPDATRILPVVPELAPLLPWPSGIRRGATVAAVGSTSLVMTLLAAGMTQGAWAAVVGLPTFGALAAGQDFTIPLQRLALVPEPGPDWPTVVSALIDGVDLVVVAAPAQTSSTVTRALMSRARQKGCVLLPTTAWNGCDLAIERLDGRWSGLGQGRGRLRQHTVTLRAHGRGRAGRPRIIETLLPPASISGPPPDLRIPPPSDPVGTPEAAAVDPPEAPAVTLHAVPRPVDPWEELVQHRRRPSNQQPVAGLRGTSPVSRI